MKITKFFFQNANSFVKRWKAQPFQVQWPRKHDKVFVAMSGGVDSSFSAYLLKKQGFNVEGVFMRNWLDEDDAPGGCPAEQDWSLVQKVCKQLDIPSRRFNFEKDYWTRVFEPSLELYEQGCTPNPDVPCNRYVKFGALYEALENEMSREWENGSCSTQQWWLATGHYAKTMKNASNNQVALCLPKDRWKDQTLFLCTVQEKALQRTIFPLHNLEKKDVKRMAAHAGLNESADRLESQGLCFVSPNVGSHFRSFLGRYLASSNEPIRVVANGKVVGFYPPSTGCWSYTIGERCGLSLPQGDPEFQGRWYIWKKEASTNTIFICHGSMNPLLFRKRIRVNHWTWSTEWIRQEASKSKGPIDCSVRVRHQQTLEPAKALFQGDGLLVVDFLNPQRALTPGQVLAMYNDELCLGGGSIAADEP
ncbi:tRNA(5-methylaminomethyl-2-thiouridylate)-methyltransferase [Schizosaccharomyces cryophilus OY26]|uniref:tRNA-5-taurinomethyluridine 2-sulfurtransferase n=1 Tax=Schizosaccharomyces cryophilus (strain OY26 / ATCC MYA-4695 / CBS 11777 / NBRC 106824 / NRRL Y48691) TaxID=653667 RepID=S9VT29_SCHCR|nr:tRNA(5-methylaminomethyl-2-thiouridylate)-methyltransferase [Schizosaccharomyces cryophilus OY26]EPY51023.1 tRNA(5-methylaminomethyl-2-thiouridylate)-methyltransferase [Schizosaccharomyces cryophilus OY26]